MTKFSALEWTARFQQLVGRERQIVVELVLALADFDRQRGYIELGYSSLWDYVSRALGQSETMTHYRVRAARFVQRFPQAVEPLRAGRLCITTLATLAPVVTEANCDDVLAEAMGKPKREVERIKARLAPKPVPRDVVRKAPALVPAQVAASPVQVEMLTEELVRRHLTTDREFEELLASARAALSHTLPGASELEILKQGLRCIIRDHEKRRGLTDRPHPPKQPTASPSPDAAIPRQVKRTVWQRDQGRCQWPTEDGGICGSRRRVQFHHVVDRGKGGPSTEDNLMLACAIHNQHAADQTWGRAFMEKFRRARRAQHDSDRSASPWAPQARWPPLASTHPKPADDRRPARRGRASVESASARARPAHALHEPPVVALGVGGLIGAIRRVLGAVVWVAGSVSPWAPAEGALSACASTSWTYTHRDWDVGARSPVAAVGALAIANHGRVGRQVAHIQRDRPAVGAGHDRNHLARRAALSIAHRGRQCARPELPPRPSPLGSPQLGGDKRSEDSSIGCRFHVAPSGLLSVQGRFECRPCATGEGGVGRGLGKQSRQLP